MSESLRLHIAIGDGICVGDLFSQAGYDVVARMEGHNGGRVLVLNNNSTHYLVAIDYDDREAGLVKLVASFKYGDGAPAELQYNQALLRATHIIFQGHV